MRIKFNIILGIVICFLLISDLTRLQRQLLKQSKDLSVTQSSLPSPTTQVLSPSPIPTATPISHPLTSSRHQVEFKTAKQLDDPQLQETYLISFDKVTPNSAYKISNDHFATLAISDDNYEFSLQIPKEGFSNPFKTIPPTAMINTQYLGTLTRITNPYYYSAINPVTPSKNQTEYYYSSDFGTNCSQWSPIPAACSFLQVASNNRINPENKIYSTLICKTENSTSNLCDQLISTLEIELK